LLDNKQEFVSYQMQAGSFTSDNPLPYKQACYAVKPSKGE
jgi:hypothetical protein